MLSEVLKKLINSQNLTETEAAATMDIFMRGDAPQVQMAAVLTALRLKGETVDEITGLARSMRRHAVKVEINSPHLVDTCGTGGDQSGTFNISTGAALVASAAGVKIVKHGNRSVSSVCGSADVLEALGIKIDMGPEEVKESVEKFGFGFMFAPLFHKAMKHVAPVRKELGIRTVFNILGPLASPAGAHAQLLGVYQPELTETMARVLRNLGTRSAYVVHGLDGIDEFSTVGETKISRLLADGRIESYFIDCRDLGLTRAAAADLKGGNAETNAAILKDILEGKLTGPKRDILILNAGAAILVGSLVNDLKSGIKLATEAIDSGAAADKLKKLVKFSGKLAKQKNA